MKFLSNFGFIESVFLGVFILFYLLFLWINRYKTRSLLLKKRILVIKIVLRSIYIACILVAMLAPSFQTEKQQRLVSEKQIFCLVDVSKSMDANDVQPSRLQKVQYELQNLVTTQKGNKIGLIVFASEAFVQCPLTNDLSLLKDVFLPSINSNMVYSGGTDVGAALKLAAEKMITFKNYNKNDFSGQVILLYSDGEDFGKLDNSVLKTLKENQIQVFIIGTGTPKGGKILTANGYKKTPEGQEIVTKLNSDYLNNLTQTLNGRYWEMNDQLNPTFAIATTLTELKGSIKNTDVQNLNSNQYFYFLLAALLLIVIDMLWVTKPVRINY
jgi:Ca-activated chloride channel homolog